MASLHHRHRFVLVLAAVSLLLPGTESFGTVAPDPGLRPRTTRMAALLEADADCEGNPSSSSSRRAVLGRAAAWSAGLVAAGLAGSPLPAKAATATASENVQSMRSLLLEAKTQLDRVPGLVKEEKWDGVRSVLMDAPLRDCWSKTTPILKTYAEALGDTGGDELAALEGKEDLLQHLRFLDMAVYNNVFNPISTEGKTGASKALIDSYYNDPTREYDAAKKALDELLQLSN